MKKIPHSLKLWVVVKHMYDDMEKDEKSKIKCVDDLYSLVEKKFSKRSINKAFLEILREDTTETIKRLKLK
jgi:hypothetical protein